MHKVEIYLTALMPQCFTDSHNVMYRPCSGEITRACILRVELFESGHF